MAAKPQPLNPEDTLTPREFEVVALLARGLRYKDIALDLGVGMEAIKHYFRAIRTKTGMDNMVAVAVWFVRKYQTEDDEAAGYERAVDLYIQRTINIKRRVYGLGELGR